MLKKISVIHIILAVMLSMTLFLSIIRSCSRKGEEIEIPVETVHEPQIKQEYLTDDNGHYHYEDDTYTSMFGIDVAEFQDVIDWKKVKDAGVEFAYMRLGRRGATTGLLYIDDNFEQNYANARKNGIKIGVYFFSQATTVDEAKEEARFVLENLRRKKIDLPIAYDLEEVYLTDETPRIEGISKEAFTENALAFCKEIEKAGYKAVIYANQYWLQDVYDMDILSDYPIWFAMYDNDIPAIDLPIYIWQYTNEGKMDGIKENVDFDIMFIEK